MDVPIIVAFFAAIIVGALIEFILHNIILPEKPTPRHIIAIVVGVFVFSLIALLPNIIQQPQARITSHHERDDIPRQITLAGVFDELDDDANLWVYVHSPSSELYYFNEAALFFNDKTWEIRGLLVGSEDDGDRGKPFELGLLLTDEQLSQQIRNDISELPKDAKLLSKIIVYRIGEISVTPTVTATLGPTSTPTQWVTVELHTPETQVSNSTPTAVPTEPPAPDIIPTPIPTAAPPEAIVISEVVGVGELTEEAVQIINFSARQIGLADWTLSDESGFIYTFNQVTLFGEGAGILIHTEAGTDGPTDLYWGLELPILVSGKILSLKDADDNVVSTYTVP